MECKITGILYFRRFVYLIHSYKHTGLVHALQRNVRVKAHAPQPRLRRHGNVLKAASKRQHALNTRITWVPRNCIPRLLSLETPFIKSRTPVIVKIFNDEIILTTYNTRSLGYIVATYLPIHYSTNPKANLTIA